ncbi:uncharacterized protein [Penaeus vannamei]|uniref:uncharacterized protein n=1 Tax=Penaeus vannamei TaxID=6689 RepID=UPI00387F6288
MIVRDSERRPLAPAAAPAPPPASARLLGPRPASLPGQDFKLFNINEILRSYTDKTSSYTPHPKDNVKLYTPKNSSLIHQGTPSYILFFHATPKGPPPLNYTPRIHPLFHTTPTKTHSLSYTPKNSLPHYTHKDSLPTLTPPMTASHTTSTTNPPLTLTPPRTPSHTKSTRTPPLTLHPQKLPPTLHPQRHPLLLYTPNDSLPHYTHKDTPSSSTPPNDSFPYYTHIDSPPPSNAPPPPPPPPKLGLPQYTRSYEEDNFLLSRQGENFQNDFKSSSSLGYYRRPIDA